MHRKTYRKTYNPSIKNNFLNFKRDKHHQHHRWPGSKDLITTPANFLSLKAQDKKHVYRVSLTLKKLYECSSKAKLGSVTNPDPQPDNYRDNIKTQHTATVPQDENDQHSFSPLYLS